jgi:hypothetical protein
MTVGSEEEKALWAKGRNDQGCRPRATACSIAGRNKRSVLPAAIEASFFAHRFQDRQDYSRLQRGTQISAAGYVRGRQIVVGPTTP